MNDLSNTHPAPQTSRPAHRLAGFVFDAFLVLLILTGIFFRFNWVNWSQDTNLHPDEYGLTNTLTQLAIPKTIGDYFNTRLSSISPYQKYDLQGQPAENGPDNRMRWGQLPITIIRWAGETTGNTGYGEIRLLGRSLSAFFDTLTLLLIFLIGRKLYGRRAGLLAAALSALAVMQIQQSHFMTVDNFGTFFTTLGLFACVQIAARPPVERAADGLTYQLARSVWGWYVLFGAALGLALACKVNLLPVGGLVLVATFISIADLKLKQEADLLRIFGFGAALLALTFVTAGVVFRVAQPMSFRAPTGDTSLITLHLNQDGTDSMKVASDESSGQGGGPPGEQWAHRPAILFPLTNMVLWGMGLPLGLAAWLAFCAALWGLRRGRNWQAHLLPLVWTGGYFLFMGTRWVKSVRYFLPIYPFLCLLAAWGLLAVWQWAVRTEAPARRPARIALASALMGLTVLGTLAWAGSFVRAVYLTPVTRIQAAEWIYQNIPGPFTLTYQAADGSTNHMPLSAQDDLHINAALPYSSPAFKLPQDGVLTRVVMPHVQSAQPGSLRLVIALDPDGKQSLGETSQAYQGGGGPVTASFNNIHLQKDASYYLVVFGSGAAPISINRSVIANESWDEGLPMPFDGYNPFGGLYSGRTMEVRWPDDAHKRDVLLATLAETDYLIMPSQRAIWSTCRIPLTYPMTMEYYRALFDGRLGFEQVASFSAPFQLGPLRVSDVGGSLAWNANPALPLFNHSLLAAEEAFSVYDHPPVWIFKKRADFNLQAARQVLSSVDLSKVVVQSPLDAAGDWCPAQ